MKTKVKMLGLLLLSVFLLTNCKDDDKNLGSSVTSVSLSMTTLTLEEGSSKQLTATVLPKDAFDKAITWASSNTAIATVDKNGKITAIKPGKATISVTTEDGGKTAKCSVTVTAKVIKVTDITLTPQTLSLEEQQNKQLTTTIVPANATNKKVSWISNDPKIATVNASGKVTAVKAGKTTISVTTVDGNKMAKCEVTVTKKKIKVTGVKLNKRAITLYVGTTEQLEATVLPTNATNKAVTWSSSNKAIATVDAKGKVTAVKAGKTTISVTTVDGNKMAKCEVTVTKKKIKVTGVKLNKRAITLYVGTNKQLKATVLPTNATNKAVTWSSSNKAIATVDAKGKVTAVKAGKATITVKTKDGGKTAKCSVTVTKKKIKVTGVTLTPKTLSLEEQQSKQLTAKVAPANATNKAVTWTSSNKAIATVDAKGKVTAVKAGKATITVKTKDGGKTAKCIVTVTKKKIKVTGVKLNKRAITLYVGTTEQLEATVLPANATNKAVTWSSNNKAIATVDSKGKITAVKAGKATITVKTKDGGKTAKCIVTVTKKKIKVTGVTLTPETLSLEEQQSKELTATVAPANATNKAVTWSSSNKAIATVDANGKVTAVKAGKATITVRTKDGGKTATCEVTVKAPLPKERMTLITEKKAGENMYIILDAATDDRPDIWVDLNNNQVKDSGEEYTDFEQGQNYTIQNQTITIYGKATFLFCGSCELTQLDVKQNKELTKLTCLYNKLTQLNISNNTQLTELICSDNDLSNLNVSNNKQLTDLRCGYNEIKQLNVRNNKQLTILYCDHNQLTQLDLSRNKALERLNCSSNEITQLDVSGNTELTYLDCGHNKKLTQVNAANGNNSNFKYPYSGNDPAFDARFCPKLTCIKVDKGFNPDAQTGKKAWKKDNTAYWNNTDQSCDDYMPPAPVTGERIIMTTSKAIGEQIEIKINTAPGVWIDLNNNGKYDSGEAVFQGAYSKKYTLGSKTVTLYGKVTYLKCSGNKLTQLDISKNTQLVTLVCCDNRLSTLNVSENKKLKTLKCRNNQLKALDVSKNNVLTSLNCESNLLKTLNLNSNLKELFCDNNNHLYTLDVSKSINLEILYVGGNYFESINLSKNKKLKRFSCINSFRITSIDISQNKNLTYLECGSNFALKKINAANGNNKNFKFPGNSDSPAFDATNCPKLKCIKVDKGFKPWEQTGKKRWEKDPTASWRNDGSECP